MSESFFFFKPQDLESTRMSSVACAKCGKKFRLKLQLRQHERGHSHYRPYCCKKKQCGKIFSHFSDLQHHSRIHSQHWLYQCGICRHHFPSWRSLRVHLLSHSTVQLYTCHECSAAFSHHYSLAYHMWKEHRQRNVKNRRGRSKAKMKRPCLNICKPLENNNKTGYSNGIVGRFSVRKEVDAGTDNSDSEFNESGKIDNGDLSVRLSQKIANHIKRQRRKRKILSQKSFKEIGSVGETKKKHVEIGELLRMKNKKLNAKSPVKINLHKFNRIKVSTIKNPSTQLSDMATNKGRIESGSIVPKSVSNGEMTDFEQLNSISSKREDIPLARFKLHGKNIQELDIEKRVKVGDDGDDTDGLDCPDDVVMIDLDGNTPSSEGEPYSDDDVMEEEEISRARHAQLNINTVEIKQNSLIQPSLSPAVHGIDNDDEVVPVTVSTFIIEQDLIYPDDKVSLIKEIDDVGDEKNDFSKAFNSFVAISKCKKHTVDDSGVEIVSDTSSQRISSCSSHFYSSFTSECDVSSEKKSDQPTGSEENNNSKSSNQCTCAVEDSIEQCTDLETDIPCILSQISSSTDQSRKAERAPDLFQQQFLSFLSTASRDDNDCNETESIRNRRSKRGQKVFCHCCFGQHEERRHRHKSEEKKYRLPQELSTVCKENPQLVQIREKLHQLFLVLFPKCKDLINEIRPVSEKFDKLIHEIVQILHHSDDLNNQERFDHQAVQASLNSNSNDHLGKMGKDYIPSKKKIGVDAGIYENCQHIEKSTSELPEGIINCKLCCDTQNRNILEMVRANTQNLSGNFSLNNCCKCSKDPNLDKLLFNPHLNPITDSQAMPSASVQSNSDNDNVYFDYHSSRQKEQAFHIAGDTKEGAETSLDSDNKFKIESGPLDKKLSHRQPCSKEIQCRDVKAGSKVGEHEWTELRDENNSLKKCFNHEFDSEVKEGKECGNIPSSDPQCASDIAVLEQQYNHIKTPQKENVSDNNYENDKSEKMEDNSSETKITPTDPVSIEQSQESCTKNINFHVASANSTGNGHDIDYAFAECDRNKTVMTKRIGTVDKKLALIDLSVPQVSLCKNPDKCLNSLQRQLCRLIHFLLPDLTPRTSIYRNWDNLELLLDLLIKCNQERQMEGDSETVEDMKRQMEGDSEPVEDYKGQMEGDLELVKDIKRQSEGDSEPVENTKSRIENCGFDCEEGKKSGAPKLDVAVQSDFQDEEDKNMVFASDSLKKCSQVELPYHSSSENEDIVFPGLERLQSLHRMDVADDRSVTSFVSSPESEMENITTEMNMEMDQLSLGLNKASDNSHRKSNSQTTFHGFEFTCTDSDSELIVDSSTAADKSSSISSSLSANRTRSSKDKNIFELLQPTHISASLS